MGLYDRTFDLERAAKAAESTVMPKTRIQLTYQWRGAVRFAIVILPIRHAENAYAWMKAHYRKGGGANQVFVDIQQLFGDVFICAGYFLGHLDGLGLGESRNSRRISR